MIAQALKKVTRKRIKIYYTNQIYHPRKETQLLNIDKVKLKRRRKMWL